jgi:hypothetical protein
MLALARANLRDMLERFGVEDESAPVCLLAMSAGLSARTIRHNMRERSGVKHEAERFAPERAALFCAAER